MSLFAELKRRNVFKVGAAYLVMAWLVMQVTDVVLNNVEAPGWVFHVVTMFLVMGFLFALFFAWVYEMTPEGLKREKDVDRSQSITTQTGRKLDVLVIGFLALALGYFAFDKFVLGARRDAALVEATTQALTEQAAEQEAPVDETPSIAVLPFVNMSSDAEQEYFSDGLSEELLNLLAKIPDLRVTSRSSAFFYKGKDIKIADVGRELNVANVLEGSVRKAGNTIRVTAQLIRVEDDVHLWSETYDRSLEDVFAIQDEIAASVVDQLRVELLGDAPNVAETDPEAYALYLQARELGRQFTAEGFSHSIELYERVLAIDPDYAPAWLGISMNYVNQAAANLRDYKEGFAQALQMTQKALSIDPDFARAHSQLGWIAMYGDGDLAAAARHFEKALQLEPGDVRTISNAASLTYALGRLDQTIALEEFALARDPVSPTVHNNIASSYVAAGRYDDAITALETTLRLSPGRIISNYAMGVAYLLKGDAEAALESMQRETLEEVKLSGLSLAWYTLGREAEADAALQELIDNYAEDYGYQIATIYAFRGEATRAFEWLDKEIERYGSLGPEVIADPILARLHNDPRWPALMERLGQSQSLLDSIEFNIKLPTERQLAQASKD